MLLLLCVCVCVCLLLCCCWRADLDVAMGETERVILYVQVATEFDDAASESAAGALGVVVGGGLGVAGGYSSHSSNSPLSASSGRHVSSDPSGFLQWLSSVCAALLYFTQHPQFVNAAQYARKLRELQRRAAVELEREYERLLTQHCKPLDITRLQWPLRADVELMPASIVQQLAALAGGLSACGATSAFVACVERELSAALRATLKKVIKDEQLNPLRDAEEARRAEGGADGRGRGTGAGGESKGGDEREVSRSSLSSRQQSSTVNPTLSAATPSTPAHSTLTASQASPGQLLHKAGSALSVKERLAVEERRRLELYRKHTHSIIFHVDFFLGLLHPQRALLHRLLLPTSLSEEENPDDFARLLAATCREPLAYLVRKEEERVRNWGKVELKQENRLLALLDVTQHCTQSIPLLSPSFPTADALHPFTDFTQLLQSTLRRQLVDYAAYLAAFDEERAVGKKKKAADGSVYVLTIEVLQLLRRLADYQEALEGMSRANILPDQQEAALPGAREKAERERMQREKKDRDDAAEFERSKAKGRLTPALLEAQLQRNRERERRQARDALRVSCSSSVYASLLLQLLTWLEGNMESRAKQLRSPALASLFLLNNQHYIAAYLQRHHLAHPSLHAYYRMAAQQHALDYRSYTWTPILSSLPAAADCDALALQLQAEQAGGGGGGDKAKKAIKAVFASFNAHFEELYAAQRPLSVPEPALRAELRSANAQLLLPRYRAVWDRLSGLSFTSKQNKYCKLPPNSVEAMCSQFFDEA